MESHEVSVKLNQLSNTISCIEFPEFVDSSDNFLNKIDYVNLSEGREFVYKPFSESSDRIKVTSTVQKRNLIVLKIKRDSCGFVKEAEMIGIVEKNHAFRELFDFTAESQFETCLKEGLKEASRDLNLKKIDNIANIVNANGITDAEIDWDSFSIPPYKFSHYSLPLCSKDIRSTLKISQKDDSTNQQQRSWNVPFDQQNIPTKPTEDCIQRAKNLPQYQIETVAKIFEERPIVSKLFLLHKIKDQNIILNLKYILPVIAYHWKNGPWHLLWTKYGLDPRKDSKYRFFQSIELRNKMFAKELRRGKSNSSKVQTQSILSTAVESSTFCFDGENLVLNYLTYQYIDLTYQPLLEIVNYPGDIRQNVSDKEGWYPEGTSKRLREIMKIRWFELLRSMDLTSFSQEKLEEILEITTPVGSSPVIGADWNSLSRSTSIQITETSSQINSENEDFKEGEEEEFSDYEIFDY